MSFLIKDRVLETCSSPGTGAVTLLGAVTGYQSFSGAFSSTNGTTTYYCIADQGGANWEVGLGTWNTGNTLTRTTVYSSSNGGSTVNFASGTQNVFCTYPAEYAVYQGGPLGTPSSGTVTNLTGTASININGTVGATTPTTGAFTTLSTTGDITMSGTGEIQIPTGTTAQRSGSPVTGMIRYNSSLSQYEGYNGSAWVLLGGAVVSNDTSTATAVYPLFAHSTSGNISTVYTSSTQYEFTPSTGLLTAPFYAATGTITGSLQAGAFSYGTLPSTSADVNIFASFTSSVNTYNQIILQNTNTGSAASTDFVVNNNNSTATTYYGDYGMNGSGWTGTAGTNSFNAPNMVYLTSTTADLAIGTTTSNSIRFVVNSGADALLINTSGNVSTPNQLAGAEVSATNGLLMMATTISTSATVPTGYNSIMVGPYNVASGASLTISSGQRMVVL